MNIEKYINYEVTMKIYKEDVKDFWELSKYLYNAKQNEDVFISYDISFNTDLKYLEVIIYDVNHPIYNPKEELYNVINDIKRWCTPSVIDIDEYDPD